MSAQPDHATDATARPADAHDSEHGGADRTLRLAPRRFSPARLWLFKTVENVCRALGGRAYYRRMHLERAALREETVLVRGLAPALDGFSIVQLSDVHAGPFLGRGDLASSVDRVLALAPDLVVYTGDLITHEAGEAWLVLEDLGRLRARYGVYGVFGNHDYHGRREREIRAAYLQKGLRFLLDEAVALGPSGAPLWLVGLEDLEEAKGGGDALADVPFGACAIALCHNPAGATALHARGVQLVLSGHTHGAQVNVPWLRRLAPPHPGDRVDSCGGSLIVSRGLGALGLPLRVRARAELVRIVLRCAPTARAGEVGA
jgi:predicted MPP superfamily phosphohydrolase